MQTLTAGSFLNFENDGAVEALKFTACRLAEHTVTVVTAENLNAASIKNLANNLWNKAEYVTRETERRRLHEIFVENFCERFRELKPEVAQADNSGSEVLSAGSTIGNADLVKQSLAPEITECRRSECPTAESVTSVSPQGEATEVEGKRDEFLGFVKTDEPFAATSIAETEAATITAPDEAAPKNEFVTETSKWENKYVAHGATNSENERVAAVTEVSAENPNVEKSQPAATVATENNSQAVSANKNSTNAATDTKEPFEFLNHKRRCIIRFTGFAAEFHRKPN